MSQAIECTECHDMIDIEGGRVIDIPFVCNACVDQVHDDETEPNFYKCDDSDCWCQKAPEGYEPEELAIEEDGISSYGTGMDDVLDPVPCDTASVENTTLLIEDLEAQLQRAKDNVYALGAKLEQAEEYIRNDSDRYDSLLEKVGQMTQEKAELTQELENTKQTAAKLLKAFLERI